MVTKAKNKQYREVDKDGNVTFNFNKPQALAWASTKRFICLLCGTQVGKTVFGPDWLHREIDETYNPDDEYNDYIIATSAFPLLNKKVLPETRKVFENIWKLAKYNKGDKIFEFRDSNIRIFMASAASPGAIESATAKAAWLDEAGQDDFNLATWEAIRRRLSRYRGRALITTTLYNFGWLKTELYDKWLKDKVNSDIDVIQADSIDNPVFPQSEYYARMKEMPKYRFDLMYRGVYSKPAGMIYDAFDTSTGIVKRFPIPDTWPRFVGMDFGQHSTACIFLAMEPTSGALYAYREYLAGGKSAAEHAIDLREVSKGEPIRQVTGGSAGEDGWRDAFTMAGWHVSKPFVKDVEVGIDKTYAFMKTNKFFVFSDLERTIKELTTYSRIIDGDNTMTEKIQDKERFHVMDALRYICGELNATNAGMGTKIKVRSYL